MNDQDDRFNQRVSADVRTAMLSWFEEGNPNRGRNITRAVLGAVLIMLLCILGAVFYSVSSQSLPVLPADAPALPDGLDFGTCPTVEEEVVWDQSRAPYDGSKFVCGRDNKWKLTSLVYSGKEYEIPKVESFVTEAPTEAPATEAPTAVTQECSLTDHGLILALTQVGDKWVFNPAAPQVLDGDGNIVDRPDLVGCNLLAQGQKDPSVEEGHLWVIRDEFTRKSPEMSYLEADGTFVCSNCAAWAFPKTWNMSTWNAPEGQGVVYMFVTDLRTNMTQNVTTPHDWPIFAHLIDGTTITYNPGQTAGVETGATCKGLAEPQRIRVTGIVGEKFVGSLGETGCWSVAWKDGASEYQAWNGAYDNFEFTQVEYWLMPFEFDETATRNWADNHPIP